MTTPSEPDPAVPIAERVSLVLEKLCGERPPADVLRRWLDGEGDEEWNSLQDWVGTHMPPWEWAATIAVIEAAQHIATESRV